MEVCRNARTDDIDVDDVVVIDKENKQWVKNLLK
jgi:hypothetical protein